MDIKLIDFGFAKSKAEFESPKTMNTQLGTPRYAAPEITDKNLSGYFDNACPEKVDLWSTGGITYNVLSGQHCFTGSNKLQLIRNIKNGNFHFRHDVYKEHSEQCQSFIKCCLELDPINRPSAEKMLTHPWLSGNDKGWEKQYQKQDSFQDFLNL